MTRNYASMRWLSHKPNPVGWMCAIKRPSHALVKILLGIYAQYTTLETQLPDYFIKIDDDSWINADRLARDLPTLYPADQPIVAAGCMIRERIQEHNFTIPFGGWSVIWNRLALQNLLHPIHCRGREQEEISKWTNWTQTAISEANTLRGETGELDAFTSGACTQLSKNAIGETPLFQDGMNLVQLMDAYVKRYRYQDIDNWRGPGFW